MASRLCHDRARSPQTRRPGASYRIPDAVALAILVPSEVARPWRVTSVPGVKAAAKAGSPFGEDRLGATPSLRPARARLR